MDVWHQKKNGYCVLVSLGDDPRALSVSGDFHADEECPLRPAPQPPAQEELPGRACSEPGCEIRVETEHLQHWSRQRGTWVATPYKPAPAPETKGERLNLELCEWGEIVGGGSSRWHFHDCKPKNNKHVTVVPESRVAEARKQAVEDTLREVLSLGTCLQEDEVRRAALRIAESKGIKL